MKKANMIAPILVLLTSGAVFSQIGDNMKGSIADSVHFKKDEKSVTALFSGPFKVIGIGLMKGQKLEKHQTPTAAFLCVQSGSVVFSMGGKKESLRAGEFFSIPPKELHEVEASEDSKLLLVK